MKIEKSRPFPLFFHTTSQDQSLRAWLCGGEIVRAKSSRIAHMWRTGDRRTVSWATMD